MSNRNITPHTLAGVPLPSGWKEQAKINAASADKAYLDRLTNAWRGNLTTKNESIVASAQLGRRDSSRMDALVLVEETDEFEVWEANGARVIKKK